jgi:seryl-tRNA synthetase
MPTSTIVGLEFYANLVRHKLIMPSGVPGVFGRGAVFEDIVQRFDALVSRITERDGAERAFFPPVLDRRVLEKSGYLDAFPHLAGSVFSFQGTDAQHQELGARAHWGRPWSDLLVPTDVVLAPAACYSVYPICTGMVPESGRLVDTCNWVFRHEPSAEPTRLQAFRMREVVRIGSPAVVVAWRDMWLTRGLELLRSLELAASAQVASDPFFGRGGRLLAASQRQQELKFEVMIPIISDDEPTAVCSFNYHQDHFGGIFDICTPDGRAAHSACLGFGMERVTMALLKTHGFIPASWPAAVRERLGL